MSSIRPYFRYLECNNGTEFISKSTEQGLDQFEIQVQTSEPFAHQHQDTIERLNCSSEERIRSLLFVSDFPNSFWGPAAHAAAYLYNRTPHAALEFLNSYKKAFHKQHDLYYLRISGS